MSLGWNWRGNAQESTQAEIIAAVKAACKETGLCNLRMHWGGLVTAPFESAVQVILRNEAKLERP